MLKFIRTIQRNTNYFEEMHHSMLELFFLLLFVCMTNFFISQPKTNSELPENRKIGYSYSSTAGLVLHLLFFFCCVIKTVLKTDAVSPQKR